MASALLASRNEPCWGEQKVYMRKNPNPNPNPNPWPATNPIRNNPNPKERALVSSSFDPHDRARPAQADDPPAAATVSDNSLSFNRKSVGLNHHHLRESGTGEGGRAGYVTFSVSSYSKRELRDLRKRLISELEQVRALSSRIEMADFQSTRSAGYSASSYRGECEVTSATTRPLLVSQSPPLDSRPADFVTGKDKVASPRPTENHKKFSGSKRPLLLASPREAKRQVTTESEKLLSGMMKKCAQILTKLMKHKHGWIFNSPVDVVSWGLHDYNQIIKRPMDLGTVKSQLKKNLYRSPSEFADDIRLTFNNALIYNPEGHEVHNMADQLLTLFENLFGEANRTYEKQKCAIANEEDRSQRSSMRSQVPMPETVKRAAPTPTNLLPVPTPVLPPVPIPTPVHQVAPTQKQQQPPVMVRSAMVKQPKPKAKDPNKREMSFEEKKKLSLGLESLPQEKMAQVVQIVQRRNPDPALHGDEIELDFEVLDTETLWELDRFVCNCKKLMSKIKRQEALSGAAPAADLAAEECPPIVGETIPGASTAAAAKKNKGGDPGDEDVDIGEEMPSTHFPPVEIEKDTGYGSSRSSSSSSSSSGSSSSSDSDSGSSSGSDSDADDAQSPAVGLRRSSSPGN